jgi:hypothetical protein
MSSSPTSSESTERGGEQNTGGQPGAPPSGEQKPPQVTQPGATPGTPANSALTVAQRGVIGGLGVVALGLISLGIGYFQLRRRLKNLETPDVNPGSNTQTTHTHNFTTRDRSGTPSQTDEQTSDPFASAALSEQLKDLRERVENLERQSQTAHSLPVEPTVEITEVEPLEVIAEKPPGIQPPAHVTVDKMMEWAKNAGLRLEAVKANFGLFGNLSQSEEGDNWLAIGTPDNDRYYLFPRVNRFESESHYKSDYHDYYNCDRPSAGTILIHHPAIVIDAEQGGWKLLNKGLLSVAS